MYSVPHASVCGGRGRCSTCRVRVLDADLQQIPPDEEEKKVLERVGAPPDVRLACQMIPSGKVKVIRLLPADATMSTMADLSSQSSGVEQVVAVLFADIRGFTAHSEAKLPFDVVYLVNQFSRAMGGAIEGSGGKVDKFLGDGLMALFGVDTSPQEGCRAALEAAEKMQHSLNELNIRLEGDLDEPLEVGIGIHAGPVVLGEMGYGASRGLTAIGDTVNTASRLEAATKELGVTMCISSIVAELAGNRFEETTRREITIRGKKRKLKVHALKPSDVPKPVHSSP
jgi:adenylate cyclase